MTGPAPGGAAPEPVTETWTYGGIRAGKDGKKWHAWLDPAGEEHWFARTGGRMAVGSHYTAQVTRRDGGGISLHGTPEYAGSQAGQETRAALRTAHTLAQTRIESLRAERDAARRNALDAAIAPLLELAVPLRTGAQRDALAAYVIRKLHSTWNTRMPLGGRQQIRGEVTCDYLVSGEFRVHRDGCRDCEKEARRSDSAGDAEEYASQADVIAGLWSDIIAENPELYGTPGGLASLEAETIFLPCTSGLPGTSPAGEGGQPGDAEELAAWAAGLGLEAEDLDDLVHDAYSKQASEVNNGGLDSQVRFLIESYGTGGARSLLSDLRPEAAGRASAAGTAAPAAGAEQRPPSAPGR